MYIYNKDIDDTFKDSGSSRFLIERACEGKERGRVGEKERKCWQRNL